MLDKFGKDVSFLNTTSLTRPAFHQLLRRFSRYYYILRHNARSGSATVLLRRIDGAEHALLGVRLPSSTLSRYLRQEEEVLSNALEGFAPARISWSSPARQVSLEKVVEAHEPLLKHTFGFIDGKNLRNTMYNGWIHTVFVTGTISFVADGCLIWCRHTCPGSWNNSDNSLGFRNKLLDLVCCSDIHINVVSDSAFPCLAAMAGRILTPLKDGDLERNLTSLRSSARTLHNAITSVRQAAE
uniref:DDE Tnp4 domain-containing protein n=1 Tax=Phytophthora ramorum TaxID=164328 RepID=H3GZG3_PHYRM